MHSDVPSQALSARLVALWQGGYRAWIVQRRGRDLKTSVIKL
jgi:hypothetical protein